MLNIKIDDEFKMTSDERNFVLQKRRIVGDHPLAKADNIGTESWDVISYCRTIKQVFTEYTRYRTLGADCQSFRELYNHLDNIEKLIAKLPDIE